MERFGKSSFRLSLSAHSLSPLGGESILMWTLSHPTQGIFGIYHIEPVTFLLPRRNKHQTVWNSRMQRLDGYLQVD